MLLIGTHVKADVVGPKTFIERNAYPISVHQLVQPFLSRISRRRWQTLPAAPWSATR